MALASPRYAPRSLRVPDRRIEARLFGSAWSVLLGSVAADLGRPGGRARPETAFAGPSWRFCRLVRTRGDVRFQADPNGNEGSGWPPVRVSTPGGRRGGRALCGMGAPVPDELGADACGRYRPGGGGGSVRVPGGRLSGGKGAAALLDELDGDGARRGLGRDSSAGGRMGSRVGSGVVFVTLAWYTPGHEQGCSLVGLRGLSPDRRGG